ncbi:MAG: T9SS type A sorting domain-containing protein [Ignavibacteria bacterium]
MKKYITIKLNSFALLIALLLIFNLSQKANADPPVITLSNGVIILPDPFPPFLFDIACGDFISFECCHELSFTVTATDPDATSISLRLLVIPAGATFPEVVAGAPPSVSSVFTWTPPPLVGGNLRFEARDQDGVLSVCDIHYDFPLPVELASFTSVIMGNDVTLNWQTVSEINNSRFDIERTLSGINSQDWSAIGSVPGNGTTTIPVSYSYTDRGLNTGRYSYRLKQIDVNGNSEFYNLYGEVLIGVPSKLTLFQNYPNPFNPVTKIDFEIPSDGNVSLDIYDNSGKLVTTLMKGFKTAGYYSEVFDASKIASGVYYYSIKFESSGNSYDKVMKMVILK